MKDTRQFQLWSPQQTLACTGQSQSPHSTQLAWDPLGLCAWLPAAPCPGGDLQEVPAEGQVKVKHSTGASGSQPGWERGLSALTSHLWTFSWQNHVFSMHDPRQTSDTHKAPWRQAPQQATGPYRAPHPPSTGTHQEQPSPGKQ